MNYDALVIGGSFAGLAAATYIGRARRTVALIDAGLPRNRFATHAHGLLGHDGVPPKTILGAARAQLTAYPTVSVVEGTALAAEPGEGGFRVSLSSGETLSAARLVLAYGIRDILPDIPGLAERWGQSVIHCPYCHGFEFSDRRLGVLALSPMSAHQAQLVAEWGPTTYFLNGQAAPDADLRADFARRNIMIEPTPVVALEGNGKTLSAISLADGRHVPIDALYVGPKTMPNSDIAEQLGCAFDEGPLGQFIRTDDFKATSVAGVYAAGDIARGAHSVTFAAADGVMAGTALHRSLVF